MVCVVDAGDPNIAVEFLENDCAMTLRARRDVAQGEELHITYIDADAVVGMRQRELEWGYGFLCRCPRCLEEENI
jgi:hypothetical protein